jgi:hypothetical protein
MLGLRKTVTYTYQGSIIDLIKGIEEIEDPEIESQKNYEFILRAPTSIGVAISGGIPIFDQIKVYAQIEPINQNQQMVKVTFKPRIEVIISILISGLMIFGAFLNDIGSTATIIFVLAGFALPIIFQLVYRSQENAVVDRFVGQLDLTKK